MKQKPNSVFINDAVYVLKLIVYLILGSLWIRVTDGDSLQIPIPLGLILGGIIAAHDHINLDRKIGYAVLIVSTLVGFWLPYGVYFTV